MKKKSSKKVEEKVEVAPSFDKNLPRGDQTKLRELQALFGNTLRLIEVPGSRRCKKCYAAKQISIGFDGESDYCKDCVTKHGSDLTFQSTIEDK